MIWTADCQEALDKISRERDRTIMAQTNKVFATMMADLVQCCLSDLGTRLNRTKYETLVTIHVHQVCYKHFWVVFVNDLYPGFSCMKRNCSDALSLVSS